jgi:SAM-dependent methyltransferase
MEIIDLGNRDIFNKYTEAKKIFKNIEPIILDKYRDEFPERQNLDIHFFNVYSLLNGDLDKKKILDLGCGSNKSLHHVFDEHYLFSPWLCRILNETSACPIGIDIYDLEGEEFEHYSKDLLSLDSLDFLATNSFDLVHSNFLFNDPILERRGNNAGAKLYNLLIPQIKRVLKPNGIFAYRFEDIE